MKLSTFAVPAAIAVMLIPALVYNAYAGFGYFMDGEPLDAALHTTAALMCAWALRVPACDSLSRFCFWWLKRQVLKNNLACLQINMQTIREKAEESRRNEEHD